AVCQLADGEIERRRYSRLRNDLQGVPERGDQGSLALRRTAPLHPGPGILVRRIDLRGPDGHRAPPTRQVALWDQPDVSGVLRSDHDPFSSVLSRPPVAVLRET